MLTTDPYTMRIFSHLFYLKKRDTYVGGPLPIYLRITIKGKKGEVSINKSILLDKWNPSGSKMKSSTEEVKSFNVHLAVLVSKLDRICRHLVAEGCIITAELLKKKYLVLKIKNFLF